MDPKQQLDNDNIKVSLASSKAKLQLRNRGRMKITIKLSKEEAEGFKNWSEAIRPENVDDEQFIKTIFFNGIEYLNQQLSKIAMEVLEKQEQEKQSAGTGQENKDNVQ